MRPISKRAGAFALRGAPADIVAQLVTLLRAAPAEFDHVVLHPIPNPPTPDAGAQSYLARVAREILPQVRAALAS
jgi:hypothetical protein